MTPNYPQTTALDRCPFTLNTLSHSSWRICLPAPETPDSPSLRYTRQGSSLNGLLICPCSAKGSRNATVWRKAAVHCGNTQNIQLLGSVRKPRVNQLPLGSFLSADTYATHRQEKKHATHSQEKKHTLIARRRNTPPIARRRNTHL